MVSGSAREPDFSHCPIWPDFPATGRVDSEEGFYCIDSARAGYEYFISPQAFEQLTARSRIRRRGQEGHSGSVFRVFDITRKKLTTWLIDQYLLGEWAPTITREVILSVQSQRLLPAHERAHRLLRFIADETPVLGSGIEFDRHAGPRNALGTRHKATLRASAWTESNSWLELSYLLDYLTGNGLLEHIYEHGLPTNYYRVTVDGHAEIARKATAMDSNKVFVAMWFDKCVDGAYYQGIGPAIRAAGYNPVRIDNIEHTGQIEDAILAEIHKSKFIVADLTEGHAGTRGGVYFEAGFAFGLGLPVIYTCRRDKFDLVHFDTNHQAQILWSDYADLKTRLQNRIEGVIGGGPGQFQDSEEEGDC